MPNPALSEKAFGRAIGPSDLQPGWGAPPAGPADPWRPGPDRASPFGPVPTSALTINGVVTATGVLLVVLCASAFVGWQMVESSPFRIEIPGAFWPALIVAIGLMFVTIFKPAWARVTAPLYAIAEGLVLGMISRVYEFEFDGIVVQAAASTVGVLAVMLFLYATRIIKVTEKLRMGIVAATGAIALVYVLSLVLRLFGAEMPFLHDTGPMGILISVVIVGVAAFNLLLDFDFIEKAAAARAPKSTEWYAAFGLLVTLVWLYLELLRLLSKLRSD